MTTIQYLSQILWYDKCIPNMLDDLKINISRYREAAEGCAVAYDGDKVQSSSLSDPTAKAAIEIVSLWQDTYRDVNQMIEKRMYIVNQIRGIGNVEYFDILHKHYVNHFSLSRIADIHGCSWKKMKRKIEDAQEYFESIYGSEYL